jgi:cell division protein FtsB
VQKKIQSIVAFAKKYQLQDPRTWAMLVFVVLAGAVTWNGAVSIQQNFALQKKVVTLQEQNNVQKLQNETQKLRNEYYKTDEYKELAARRLFGKAAAGERVYIVPKEVALSKVSPEVKATTTQQVATNPVELPKYQQNFQDWLDFFFHRTPRQ